MTTFAGSTNLRTDALALARKWDVQLKTGRSDDLPWTNVYPDAYAPNEHSTMIPGPYDPTYDHHRFMGELKRQPEITLGEMADRAKAVQDAADAKYDALNYRIEHSNLQTLGVAAGFIGTLIFGGMALAGSNPAVGLALLGSMGLGVGSYAIPRMVRDHYMMQAGDAHEFQETLTRWGAVMDGHPLPVP